ncbi:30S ribosome-binding factor RbfA [Candidatus Bipolaricaulota bacterium]|jgi:ribosome-binding factor A|nr:30S ribosome-binding factor RbfA [Candidatus Bipolaricaulota bacterium]TFH10804.1 MAG: 30S ribosome-binding factor RbfA [Candidatus Atribacteria bacterium]
MTGKRRLARLQEDIQRELAAIVEFESRDPIVKAAFPTVMDVQLSIDGRYAKVYVAAGTEIDSEAFIKALKRDQGFYRSELAHRISTRHTPELQFMVDHTVERSLRLEHLLRDEDDSPTE